MSNKQLTIRIPPQLQSKLKNYIQLTDKNKTQVILEALELYLESDEAKKDIKMDSKDIGDILLLLHRQLDPNLKIGLVSEQLKGLTNKIKNAEYDIKIRVFNQTHLFFKQCLRNIKQCPQECPQEEKNIEKYIKEKRSKEAKLLKRAIPIFDSLITNNDENTRKFHRVYAYLAYSLYYVDTYVTKEDIKSEDLSSESPLDLINKAIQIRSNNEINPEFYIYEFKRVIIKIKAHYQRKKHYNFSKDFLHELTEDIEQSITNCKLVEEICQSILDDDDERFRKSIESIIVNSDFTYKECKKIREVKELKEWIKKYFIQQNN